jgi:hypothetical protein
MGSSTTCARTGRRPHGGGTDPIDDDITYGDNSNEHYFCRPSRQAIRIRGRSDGKQIWYYGAWMGTPGTKIKKTDHHTCQSYGCAYERLGRLAEAIDTLERYASQIKNDSKELEQVLGQIRKLRGQLPEESRQQPPASDPSGPGLMPDLQETGEPSPPLEEPARPAEDLDLTLSMSMTPADDPGRGRRIGGYVLLGVGAASLVTGVIFGTLAYRSGQEAESHCQDGVCTGQAREPQERYHTQAIVADVSFGVAAVSAAVGAYLVLTGHQLKQQPWVEAGISGDGVRVALTQRF